VFIKKKLTISKSDFSSETFKVFVILQKKKDFKSKRPLKTGLSQIVIK